VLHAGMRQSLAVAMEGIAPAEPVPAEAEPAAV
jgi:hypothetical protein